MNYTTSLFQTKPAIVLAAFLMLVLLALSNIGSHVAMAADEIEPLSPSLAPPVSPNILFVLDDSGSMKYEILPDDYTGTTTGQAHVFPRAAGVYNSTSDYTNYVATIAAGSAYGALARSYHWNKTFYDPSITYTPWSKWDKSLYPNASPTCALHNPERPGTGTTYCRDLTVNLTNLGTTSWFTTNFSTSSSTTTLPRSDFLAATYYSYDATQGDAGKLIFSNYTEHKITPTITSYTGEGRDKRTDCTGGTCTYAQEIQNFANWYTYYRSRVLASRAGIGHAFAEQPLWETDEESKIRVGFGSINTGSKTVDGQPGTTVIQGLRNFWGTGREAFYNSLYSLAIPAQGTPLVTALQGAGKYYQRDDNQGPWSKTPGTASTEPFASCRQSFTILMTDGYWNGTVPTDTTTSNNDGTSGLTITGPKGNDPEGRIYTYSAVLPFTDSRSKTLADVAMYYWKTDLMPSLVNNVPATNKVAFNDDPKKDSPGFWQHMVTFGVGLGVSGKVGKPPKPAAMSQESYDSLSLFDAILTIPNNPNWGDPSGTTSTPAKIDDLLHAAVNSRGGFFSAADPKTFSSELSKILTELASRQQASGTALASNATRLSPDSLLYQVIFEKEGMGWYGELRAFSLESNGAIASTPTWSTVDKTKLPQDKDKIPAASDREIYTIFDGSKVEFTWDSLSETQKGTLISSWITDTTKPAEQQAQEAQDILNWIRGDQSKERSNGGTLRNRIRLLGDIINSDLTYVGEPLDFGYGALEGYKEFRTDKKDRVKMLYVGANDGMLHAFDALTGEEKFAFIPQATHAKLAKLVEPVYEHQYFVDGSPYVADAYLGGEWKSVLIGTMGLGGRSVFALDITEPVDSTGNVSFNTSNILWEFSDPDLGYTLGKPSIGRLQNGTWVVVFGNGYRSAPNYGAYLFVVDLATGDLIAKIDTGATGTVNAPNGLSPPSLLADANRDLVAAYAGDLKGNVWKFDLTGELSSTSTKPAFEGAPLFRARSADGAIQPITSPLEISRHPNGGYLLLFGTGKYFEGVDGRGEITPVRHSFYGIWDTAELDNSHSWTGGSAIPAITPNTNRLNILQEQTILETVDASGNTWRVVSQNEVDWKTKRGWYLDLLEQTATYDTITKTFSRGELSERVIDAPILHAGRVFFATMIRNSYVDSCGPAGGGWFMGLDMLTGGRMNDIFDVDGDQNFDEKDHVTAPQAGSDPVSVSGLSSDVGIPRISTLLNGGKVLHGYMPGSGNDGKYTQKFTIKNPDQGRRSWRQLR